MYEQLYRAVYVMIKVFMLMTACLVNHDAGYGFVLFRSRHRMDKFVKYAIQQGFNVDSRRRVLEFQNSTVFYGYTDYRHWYHRFQGLIFDWGIMDAIPASEGDNIICRLRRGENQTLVKLFK